MLLFGVLSSYNQSTNLDLVLRQTGGYGWGARVWNSARFAMVNTVSNWAPTLVQAAIEESFDRDVKAN
jgi:hypothetical protein